jgi:lipid A 3-O-deacylase
LTAENKDGEAAEDRRLSSVREWMKRFVAVLGFVVAAAGLNAQVQKSDVGAVANSTPWEFGALVQGGKGVTDNRDDFKFIMVGGHLGKVLTGEIGHSLLRGNFEYAVEVFPFWQSYTPTFQRANCVPQTSVTITCSNLFTTGGTYTGASVTPIILRWNFTSGRRFMPWAQAAGGFLWTNHKYPGFGQGPLNLVNDGPGSDASVFNFTPQGGIGFHYFVKPKRSVDFAANAVHISSASLGDKNPGVNASVQFNVGYTWWK